MVPLVLFAGDCWLPMSDGSGVLLSPEPRDGMDKGFKFPLERNENGRHRFGREFTEKCPLDNDEETEPEGPVAVVRPGQRFYVKYRVDESRPADRGMRLSIQLPGKKFRELSTGFRIERDADGENAGSEGVHYLSLKIPDDVADTPTAVLQWAWESRKNGDNAGFLGCADIEISQTKEPCGVYVENGDFTEGGEQGRGYDSDPASAYRELDSCSSVLFNKITLMVVIVIAVSVGCFVLFRYPACENNKLMFLERMSLVEYRVVTLKDRVVHGELPENWTAVKDEESGEYYYANSVTGETTWDRPHKPVPLQEAPAQRGQPNPAMPHPLVAQARGRGRGRVAGRGGGRARGGRPLPAPQPVHHHDGHTPRSQRP